MLTPQRHKRAAADNLTGGGIRAHIRRLAAPAAVGFFCQTVFNLTDAFYAGWISTAAQSALAFAFPLFFIQLSCCVGIGQALAAFAANALGDGKRARAAAWCGQACAYCAAVAVCIWALLLPQADALVAAMGAKGEARAAAAAYSRVIYAAAPVFLINFLFYGALQAAGNTTAFRNSVVVAVALNFALDPLFMFGWGPLPPLGVAGIAAATVVSQLLAVFYLAGVVSKTHMARRWRWAFARPRPRLLRQLARQSVAPMGRMFCLGLGFFVITAALGRLDAAAVAAYGIALRVEQLFLLPIVGFEIALLAYAGQNLAVGNRRNTAAAYWLCVRYGLALLIASGLLLLFGGGWLVSWFSQEAEVTEHGRRYLIAAAFAAPCYLMLNMGGAVLMAARRVWLFVGVSVARMLVLPPLLFWLFAHVANMRVEGIWLGILLAAAIPVLWLRRPLARVFARS